MDLQPRMQSMPIRTKAVRSNHDHGEVYLIQHYAIKFVSDIYHIEIEIKDGTDRAESASYLDLQL